MSVHQNLIPLRRPGALPFFLLSLISGIFAQQAFAQTPPPKPAPDVIIFANGDQLTGTLERSIGTSITFKSDVVGEITVSLDKVKELHTNGNFVVLKNNEKITRTSRHPGAITFEDHTIDVAGTSTSAPEKIADKDLAYIIDQATFNKEVTSNPGPFSGWNGSITGGATIVRSTQNSSTFNIATTLVRAIPTVPFLPARTKDTFDLSETYGKLTQPAILITNTPYSQVKTDIFHTDFEHDKYFSPRLYVLGGFSFDKNYSLGLNFQQIYGGGLGWTVIQDAKQELDFKGDIHYERQNFVPPTVSTNLIGSTFSDTYHRDLPGKLVFTEAASIIPAWNDLNAYSALGNVGLTLPTYKRLALSLNAQDNFLNNPAPGFKKNSFQFLVGVTYTLH